MGHEQETTATAIIRCRQCGDPLRREEVAPGVWGWVDPAGQESNDLGTDREHDHGPL